MRECASGREGCDSGGTATVPVALETLRLALACNEEIATGTGRGPSVCLVLYFGVWSGNAMIDRVDEDRIAAAIAEVEKKTSGEIVVVIGRSASGYHLVPIVWAAIVTLALPMLILAIFTPSARRLYEIELVVFGVLAFVLSFGRYRFQLVPGWIKRSRAHEAAREQFLARRISYTRSRTGVLLYVALAERYAELVPDAGIAELISDSVWKPVIERLSAKAREGRIADGVIAAVEECGTILAEKFPPSADNPDELPNKVVLL